MRTRGESVFIDLSGLSEEDLQRLSNYLAPEESDRVFSLTRGNTFEFFSYLEKETPTVLKAIIEKALGEYSKSQYPKLVWSVKELQGVVV